MKTTGKKINGRKVFTYVFLTIAGTDFPVSLLLHVCVCNKHECGNFECNT